MELSEAQAREHEAWTIRVDLLSEIVENMQAMIDLPPTGDNMTAMHVMSERSNRLHAAYAVAIIEWRKAFDAVQHILDRMVTA